MEGGITMCKGWIKLYRSFYKHEIFIKPPHYRETFLFLVANANHKDNMCSGTLIRRGQLHTSYQEIRDALQWYKGGKRMQYTKRSLTCAMKYLRLKKMIDSQKTTRGFIITVCEYDYYQGDGNTSVTPESQLGSTINKNEKNVKNDKKKTISQRGGIVKKKETIKSVFTPPSLEETQSFFTMNGSSNESAEDFINFYESKGWVVGKIKMKKWEAAAKGWIKRNNSPTHSNSSKSNYIKHDYDQF